MPVDVLMPQMGESIFEGTITKWLKKPGDKVERDEPLFEISTDKVDAEIPAPSAGVLREIKVAEGQTVPIQTVVAVIDAAGAAAATAPAAAPARTEGPQAAAPPTPPPPPPAAPGTVVHVTLENAVPRERIYFGRYEVQPMTVMRQRIAEHMVVSKRVSPHVYSVDEVDMTRIVQLRDRTKNEFEKRFDTKLTFTPFFVRACVEGLRAFPTVNASADGTNVVLHKEINVGIGRGVDGREGAQPLDAGAYEEGREGQLGIEALLELILGAVPQLNDAGHVHLIHGVHVGRDALGNHHVLGDALPHHGHGLHFVAPKVDALARHGILERHMHHCAGRARYSGGERRRRRAPLPTWQARQRVPWPEPLQPRLLPRPQSGWVLSGPRRP